MNTLEVIDLQKQKQDKIQLQVLKDKLQACEESPLVDSFSGKVFIERLHKKHLKYVPNKLKKI